MVESRKRLFIIESDLVPDTPAKFHRPSLPGSAETSAIKTNRTPGHNLQPLPQGSGGLCQNWTHCYMSFGLF